MPSNGRFADWLAMVQWTLKSMDVDGDEVAGRRTVVDAVADVDVGLGLLDNEVVVGCLTLTWTLQLVLGLPWCNRR